MDGTVRVAPWARVPHEVRTAAGLLLATVLGDAAPAESVLGRETLVALGPGGAALGAVRVVAPSSPAADPRLPLLVPELAGAAAAEILSVAVDPGARRRGVGRLLVGAAEDEIRARGLRTAWAAAWIHADGRSPGSELFGALGYDGRGRIERYWYRAGDVVAPGAPGSVCPDCGAPCRCTAAIHVKDLGADAPLTG